MIILETFLVFFLAFLLSLRGTPIARAAAIRFGIVDRPDGRLKTQKEPVPYLGGLAIFLSFLITLALVFEFDQRVLGLLLGGSLVVLLGLVDDFGVLTPTVKFAGQILAASVLIKSGIQIRLAFFPDAVNIILTLIWLVGVTNAFNIIDNMDGLSCGVALVATIFLLALSIINGNASIATITAALAGSLLGFLRYNYYPAVIYMGDTGSLFIGLMLGSLSIIGQYTFTHGGAFVSPLLLLGVPLYDTAYVMVLRAIHHRPVFFGSRDHIALRIRRLGMSVPQTVNLLYGVSVLLANMAFVSIYGNETVSTVLFAATVLAMIGAGVYLAQVDMGDHRR